MSLLEDLEKIQSARNDIKTALEEVTTKRVPKNIETYADKITGIKSSIDPSDIVQGKTVLGIVGTGTTGNDTSDATALAENIEAGKSAYIATGKVEGTLSSISSIDKTDVTVTKTDTGLDFSSANDIKTIVTENAPIKLSSTNAKIASAIGLTSEKLANGNTILGVSGKTSIVDTSTGTAVAKDIRNSKKAYVNGSLVTGTLQTLTEINPSATTSTVSEESLNLKITAPNVNEGIVDSTSTVILEATKNKVAEAIGLTANKIVKGNTILGITGNANNVDTTDGNAVANNIESGKVAFVDGAKVVGNIPAVSTLNKTESTVTKDTSSVKFASTQDAKTILNASSNLSLSATNIAVASAIGLTSDKLVKGNTILGVEGDANNVNTADTTANPSDILLGKTAYTKGTKINGTLPSLSNVTADTTKATVKEETDGLKITAGNNTIGAINNSTSLITTVGKSAVASAISLTANKIIKGNTILGIDGTGETGIDTTSTKPAAATNIETGKEAFVNGAKVTGSLTTNSSLSKTGATVTAETSSVKFASTNSAKSILNASATINVSASNSDVAEAIGLTSSKIAKGNTILGIAGSNNVVDTSAGDAVATNIESGKIAFVDGSKVTGSLSASSTLSKTGASVTTGTSALTLKSTNATKSILNANASISVSANNSDVATALDLTSNKIVSGNTILGVVGDTNNVDTSTGNATATNIEKGKIAFVKGSSVTGSLATASSFSNTSPTITADNTGSTLKFASTISTKTIYNASSSVGLTATYSNVASKVGLTAAKLAKGQKVLGITGTYETDLSAEQAILDNILGR